MDERATADALMNVPSMEIVSTMVSCTKQWSRQTRTYKGITKRPWKDRFKEHKKSFRDRKLISDTELSKEIWSIKDKGGTPTVKWKILRKAKPYNPNSKRCLLCLTEKLAIAEHEGRDMLNKRSEAVAKCRHQNKYALSNLDTNI